MDTQGPRGPEVDALGHAAYWARRAATYGLMTPPRIPEAQAFATVSLAFSAIFDSEVYAAERLEAKLEARAAR